MSGGLPPAGLEPHPAARGAQVQQTQAGLWWPAADPGKLRSAAAAWRSLAADVESVSGAASAVVSGVAAQNQGQAIDAFEAYWRSRWAGGSGALPAGGPGTYRGSRRWCRRRPANCGAGRSTGRGTDRGTPVDRAARLDAEAGGPPPGEHGCGRCERGRHRCADGRGNHGSDQGSRRDTGHLRRRQRRVDRQPAGAQEVDLD
ncbi:hypothetical protein [Candidatus Nephthysia bennettiae]|uniref:PPE family domain-containing protein n=1 Tax=Candidatus Nephthysia bennettiae TaxID=3127016 RepID=A0A934ND29_9BACT|nr:hypothetical protein [Candidatus Dormibacteraeota bacterium]MBJ7611596.1 hypothetical protein [Candidatus Dormibacteraeota bacterium]